MNVWYLHCHQYAWSVCTELINISLFHHVPLKRQYVWLFGLLENIKQIKSYTQFFSWRKIVENTIIVLGNGVIIAIWQLGNAPNFI